ncbi:hypothetical protein, partial [Rubrivirga sp.]|uniref:hypothetical protein n=1 Tax=Rubrivirga sp. TaxID=1885344 RepID=UPI003C716AA1
ASGAATVTTTPSGWTVTALEGGGARFDGHRGRVDVTFDAGPMSGSLVAETPGVALRSTPQGHQRHALSVHTHASTATVQGILSGRVVTEAFTLGPDGGAGVAHNTPTSVHWRVVCRFGSCTELVEYDYKMTPSGTTLWAASDDTQHEVDHVRVLAPIADASTPASVLLQGFQTLTVLDVR